MVTGTSLLPLRRADGSATWSDGLYSVLAAVNGPIEVQRRDELPEEAAIDVVVRPAGGVGGVHERHLESIIHKTLRHVILVSAHPRKLIQVTLQVTDTPLSSSFVKRAQNLAILPALLQASIAALLSTSIPLVDVYTTTTVAADSTGNLRVLPSPEDIEAAQSVHVLTFSSHNELLLAESEGVFDIDLWNAVYAKALYACRGVSQSKPDSGDANMDSNGGRSLEESLRAVVEAKIAKDQKWKTSTE